MQNWGELHSRFEKWETGKPRLSDFPIPHPVHRDFLSTCVSVMLFNKHFVAVFQKYIIFFKNSAFATIKLLSKVYIIILTRMTNKGLSAWPQPLLTSKWTRCVGVFYHLDWKTYLHSLNPLIVLIKCNIYHFLLDKFQCMFPYCQWF